MKEQHAAVEGLEWKYMDVRDMVSIGDKSVDVAFDKGTLDAMIYGSPWSPPDEVKENTRKYMKEESIIESSLGLQDIALTRVFRFIGCLEMTGRFCM
jgi:hypothetical protein